jgi:hypothetical protein
MHNGCVVCLQFYTPTRRQSFKSFLGKNAGGWKTYHTDFQPITKKKQPGLGFGIQDSGFGIQGLKFKV